MTSSSVLLSLVLLLATSMATTGYGGHHHHGFTRIHLYMLEITNGTTFDAVASRDASSTFGLVQIVDNEMRDGLDPRNSSVVGRFTGLVAFAGLVSPPGMQSAITIAFTAGKHRGSALVMMGTIFDFNTAFERPLLGGTGDFRMARGYCIMKALSDPTLVSVVYEVNLFVEKRV